MSLNVLVIPEDYRKDQFVLSPLLQRLVAAAGKPQARVRMCLDPVLGGVSQALDWTRIEEILGMYPMVHVFLLIVDRDGQPNRRTALYNIEAKAAALLGKRRILFGENAWQEIEVWALAGQNLLQGWNWQAIRAELHPKEEYFEPLAAVRGLTDEPGAGRTTLGREAAAEYGRVRSRCREDVAELEARLKAWLDAH